ncbi:MAG: SGNH/GDSL hydrolase family protein [Opitutales bacterium]|nr:SGNH/GDSL hydrolase family protein [Opitutales bacterium]
MKRHLFKKRTRPDLNQRYSFPKSSGTTKPWKKFVLLVLIGAVVGVAFYFNMQRLEKLEREKGERYHGSKPLKVLALGDSITHGKTGYDSWRRELHSKLVHSRYLVDMVGSMSEVYPCSNHLHDDFDTDHEGHWGWRIDEILNGRDKEDCSGSGKLSEWLKSYTPDLVLIHLGSNDTFQGQSTESSIDELEAVIQTLRRDNGKVVIFIAKIIPTGDLRYNVAIQDLNEGIEEAIGKWNTEKSPVFLVDQYRGFDALRYTFDAVHPNEEGEAVMATTWYQAIVDYLEREI